MIAAIIISTLIGAALGSRYRIFVILPALVVLFFIAIGGLAFERTVSLVAIASLVTLQIGYVAGCLCRALAETTIHPASLLYADDIAISAPSNNVLPFRPNNRHVRL